MDSDKEYCLAVQARCAALQAAVAYAAAEGARHRDSTYAPCPFMWVESDVEELANKWTEFILAWNISSG